MSNIVKQFKMIIPAELTKGSDGEWIVQGLASTPSKDQQGEILLPEGIDATPIDQGRGVLNWDHQKGPENTVGLLDSYQKTSKGFFVKGRLFKNHQKAKSIQEIMSSLGKSDQGRMGLSVEGKILERSGKDGKIIKKCQINAVALTMNPVNQDAYVDLVKSMTTSDEVDFQSTEANVEISAKIPAESTFTTDQVISIIKALGIGSGPATLPPGERTGGDALQPESSKKKKLKKLTKQMYKSHMDEMLDKIQKLYPNNSRTDIWNALKDRLGKKFPELNQND